MAWRRRWPAGEGGMEEKWPGGEGGLEEKWPGGEGDLQGKVARRRRPDSEGCLAEKAL